MSRSANPYKRHVFPLAIIQCAVWLYHGFNLSQRDIEDLLASAGVSATLPSGGNDPGILLAGKDEDAATAFIAAVGRHRHAERQAAWLRGMTHAAGAPPYGKARVGLT